MSVNSMPAPANANPIPAKPPLRSIPAKPPLRPVVPRPSLRPILAILLILVQATAATAAPQEEVGLLVAPTETGASLRWTLPASQLPDAEFVIHRTDDAGNTRTFAVPSPMPRAEAVGRGLIADDEYGELVATFSPDPTLSAEAREERDFSRAMLTLTTITNRAWAEVLGMVYDDTTAAAGTAYTYRVSTTVEGAPVVVGEEEVVAGEPADLPTIGGLGATTDANGVNLRWELPEEGFIVAYRVYRTEPDGTERDLAENGLFVSQLEDPETGELRPPDVLVQDTAVVANQTYAYTVSGVDVFGRETPRSEPLSVRFPDPEPLEVPLVTGVDVRDGEIELFWAAPADARIAGVGVVRSEDPMEEPALLTPDYLSSTATSYVDPTTVGGVSYHYSLVTVDEDGRTFGPSPPWATRGINLTPPSAPTDLGLTATDSSLDLSWTPPPEPDVRGYEVFALREGGEGRRVLLTSELVTGTTYRLDVPRGTLNELTLAVRAVNTSFVEGPLSDPVSGRLIDVVPPDRPILGAIRAGDGEVTLSWAYTSDPDVAGYRVLRSAQGEATDFVTIREGLGPADTLLVDDDVTPGLLHVYTVQAVDASGNVSERAAPLAATPFRLTGPGAPRNLRALASEDGGIELRWEPPEGRGILAYVVERGDGDGRFLQVGDPLLADERRFTDPRGRPGLTYRVYAIDTAGNAGAPSAEATLRQDRGP